MFVASFGLFAVRLLVPRPVGLTDNGDGFRLTCQVGAFEHRNAGDEFVQLAYQGTGACGDVGYPSGQVWLAWIAKHVGHLVGLESVLNLLVLGLVGALVAAAGIAAVVVGLPLGPRYRLVAAALMVLFVADSAFFGYFASVVTEGAAFLGILLTVGGLVLMHRDGAWRYIGAAVTTAGGILAVNSKPQTLLILPMLLVALLLVRRQGRSWLVRWTLPVVAFAAVSGVTGYLQSHSDPTNTSHMNVYHAVFVTILDGKHDTAADLADLGFPASYARYVGTRSWHSNSAWNDPLFPQYRDRLTTGNVARYYLTHPVRTTQILNRAATDLLTTREDYQGSFAEDAGFPPRAKEYRVPVFSGLMRLVAPLGLFFLLPIWVLTGWAGIRSWRRGRREIGLVVLFVLSLSLPQFVLGALGEGIENVKHQVIAGFCTAFAGVLAVIGLFPRQPVEREDDQDTEPRPVAAMSALTHGV